MRFMVGIVVLDHIVDVRQKLSNGDLTFLNVPCSLGLSVTISNQIAL